MGYGGQGFGLDLAATREAQRCVRRPASAGTHRGRERGPGSRRGRGRPRRARVGRLRASRSTRPSPDQGCRRVRAASRTPTGSRSLRKRPSRRVPWRAPARSICIRRRFARAQTEAGAPIGFGGDLLVGERSALVCGPVAVPGVQRAQEGDVVVADISVGHRGYWGDTARTFIVGDNSEAERARECITGVLQAAARACAPGLRPARSSPTMRRGDPRPLSRRFLPPPWRARPGGHGVRRSPPHPRRPDTAA